MRTSYRGCGRVQCNGLSYLLTPQNFVALVNLQLYGQVGFLPTDGSYSICYIEDDRGLYVASARYLMRSACPKNANKWDMNVWEPHRGFWRSGTRAVRLGVPISG